MRVIVCDSCNGTGMERCSYCGGSGECGAEVCPVCDGKKKEICTTCWGSGDMELPGGHGAENTGKHWKEDSWS